MTADGRTERYHDLDWIKVFVMLIVFLYHVSMFFNSFEWHIKNNEIDKTYIETFSLLTGNWMMPVFFVISGIGTFHALQKRSARGFVKERLLRLGLPLLLGVFVLSPPQVYVERAVNQQFDGSYFSFIPRYFDGIYLEIGGTGNFAFFGHHLWYLLMLLIFSFATLPLFLKRRKDVSEKPFRLLHYLILPLPLGMAVVWFNDLVNLASWGIIFYLLLYAYGFYFFARAELRKFVRKHGLAAGGIGLAATVGYVLWAARLGFPEAGTIEFVMFSLVRVVLAWNALFFILYLGDKFLNFSNGVLRYTSEASMPFYVLHQPVLVLFGFVIYRLEWSVSAKWVLMTFFSFLVIMSFYHFAVRKSNVLRIFLGLRGTKT